MLTNSPDTTSFHLVVARWMTALVPIGPCGHWQWKGRNASWPCFAWPHSILLLSGGAGGSTPLGLADTILVGKSEQHMLPAYPHRHQHQCMPAPEWQGGGVMADSYAANAVETTGRCEWLWFFPLVLGQVLPKRSSVARSRFPQSFSWEGLTFLGAFSICACWKLLQHHVQNIKEAIRKLRLSKIDCPHQCGWATIRSIEDLNRQKGEERANLLSVELRHLSFPVLRPLSLD